MASLGNVPRKRTNFSLEARKSFAFGVSVKSGSASPVNITSTIIRFVLAEPEHLGGSMLLTRNAEVLDASLGLSQILLQASDLDLDPDDYPYSVTVVAPAGYSTVILKGVLSVQENTDVASTSSTYAGINPSSSVAAYIEHGQLINVNVEALDGMSELVEYKLDLMEGYKVAAINAQTAAEVAQDASEFAQGQSEDARDAAAVSASEALGSQVTASQAAAAASASEANADADAATALASANAAGAFEATASAAAVTAVNAQESASGSAVSAQASAQWAEDISGIGIDDDVMQTIDNNAASAFRVQQDARLSAAIGAHSRLVRRDGMLRAASFGNSAGANTLYYRHADDARLLAQLAGGYYAQYYLRRVIAPSGPVLTKSMVFSASNIGIPMTATEPSYGGTATPVTYSGTWTTVGVNAGNAKLAGWEGYPLVREEVMLSYTSGSVMAVNSALLTPSDKWIGRFVTIPGAAADGAAAFVKISNITSGGAQISFTNVTAPAGAFSNVVSSVDPFKRQSTTVGDYAEYVTPTATRLGVALTTSSVGGMIEVSINGGAITPNLVPTAQQLVNDGRLAASVLTTGGGSVLPTARLLDPYSPQTQWGVEFAVADGLPAATYTVRYTSIAARNVAGGTASYLFAVAGFGHANGEPSISAAGVEIFTTYRVGRFQANNEMAIDTKLGAGTSAFVGGEAHGYEEQTQAPAYVVDGAPLTPVAATKYPAATVDISRRARIFHPDDTVAESWTLRVRYRLDAEPGLGIAQHVTAAKSNLTINSAGYLTNWDVYPTKTQGNTSDTAHTTQGVADGTWIVSGRNDAVAFWDENLNSGAVAVMHVPDAKRQTGNWTSAQGVASRKLQGAGVGGAAIGYPHVKGYVQMPPGAVTLGQVFTADARLIVGRDPNLVPQLPAADVL